MKIKVCGMKIHTNIEALGQLPIDFMGLIFYSKSPRYINDLNPDSLNILSSSISKVGVFVNEDIDTLIEQVKTYKLNFVQLHGNESADYCKEVKTRQNDLHIIKAFNVADATDFEKTEDYKSVCDYFLFDTKTPQYGGSGQKFDWNILDAYKGKTPFFLSGGITVDDVQAIKKIKHPSLYALDLNSKFEIEPGIKNIELIQQFIKTLRDE